MQHIRNIFAAPALIGLCALSSCGKSGDSVDPEATTYSDESVEKHDADAFSPWMSKADQQIAYDKRKEGSYFAYTEGRNNGGFHQFRHVLKQLPEKSESQWAVFWGLNPAEFHKVDLKLQQDGFTRSSLQVFEDGTGVGYHQAVWTKKK